MTWQECYSFGFAIHLKNDQSCPANNSNFVGNLDIAWQWMNSTRDDKAGSSLKTKGLQQSSLSVLGYKSNSKVVHITAILIQLILTGKCGGSLNHGIYESWFLEKS